ncbi:glycoside hydrolase family 43 protein [Leeuwenhoekiella parthenopeia]|uniref:Glycoside hydrolase family 43 protein n=1 Tax=Leeuwenhoekiella parthenopeia TaxID=2890320 RepID=A0ABS8GSH5_9FLAO|nr:glycoside hydrolase family 43 protein [Leeuwenhoekiella parthenopeia]MCC4212944.1 glycoside hydrolase family 43 protein [Leeuwenhoekiella parthenopeia]
MLPFTSIYRKAFMLAAGILTFTSCATAQTKAVASANTADNCEELPYINPIVPQRADPFVYKDSDGTYYFIATAPEYDRIEIRKSNTLNGLGTAEPKVIWTKHETGKMGAHIWAPELHKIDGKWYVYFAAGEVEDVWKIRMFALSTDAADPTEGTWKEEGQMTTEQDSFSLDATPFEHKGKRYLIWAQAKSPYEGTSLVLAEMDSPTSITGKELIITYPKYDWELKGYKVNEGPAVLKHADKIFITYSASATDANYALGLLWVDVDSDLMNPESWNKSETPVFYTNAEVRRFGPGHNSFTKSEDGKNDVLIYHARVYEQVRGNSLYDFNRHARARIIEWDENGFPNFRQAERD